MPQRGAISFSLSNPLGAADLLVNGSGNLKGWGQTPIPESSLLYVRGFDPQTRRYQYEVNQRFGATRPQTLTIRTPVILTASVRLDLGPPRERQSLVQLLEIGRSSPGNRLPEASIRTNGKGAVVNPMATILQFQDSLRLTTAQADSIASMNRRYMLRADSVWTGTARYLGSLPEEFSAGAAYSRYVASRRAQIDMLMEIGPVIREILTGEQRRKLPALVNSALDPRYLVLIRDGTRTYVTGGTAPTGFVGSVGVAVQAISADAITVIRTGP
jgi:hypothetical protein